MATTIKDYWAFLVEPNGPKETILTISEYFYDFIDMKVPIYLLL